MWLQTLVFNDHDILHFEDNIYLLEYLLKCYPIKVVQNCSGLYNCLNKTGTEGSKFLFAQINIIK